jgi:hypothetical protein
LCDHIGARAANNTPFGERRKFASSSPRPYGSRLTRAMRCDELQSAVHGSAAYPGITHSTISPSTIHPSRKTFNRRLHALGWQIPILNASTRARFRTGIHLIGAGLAWAEFPRLSSRAMGRWRRARFEAKVSQRAHALKKQLRQIGDSIKAFGWTNPILIDGDRVVIAGHGRLEAAISLGIVQVPPFASTI